jgi:hypothetical protein
MTLLSAVWALRPITDAIGAAVTRSRIVNTVKVKESGAIVKKIFDVQMPAGSRMGTETTLRGFKTVRVAVYQTTAAGSSSGAAPVETNSVCSGPPVDKFGVDVEFGGGREGGIQSGNNTLEVDEPPSMTNRTHLYVGEFAMLRPTLGLDLCNHTNEPINVEVFVHAFRN